MVNTSLCSPDLLQELIDLAAQDRSLRFQRIGAAEHLAGSCPGSQARFAYLNDIYLDLVGRARGEVDAAC